MSRSALVGARSLDRSRGCNEAVQELEYIILTTDTYIMLPKFWYLEILSKSTDLAFTVNSCVFELCIQT